MGRLRELLKPVGKLVPMLRRYIKLDEEEKELRPKVEQGIREVMANGDVVRKKKISEKITQRMKECKIEAST